MTLMSHSTGKKVYTLRKERHKYAQIQTFRMEAQSKTHWVVVHKPAPLSWVTISGIAPDKTRRDTNQSRQCS